MRALDCCHRRTSPVSRKSQPFPTMPCFDGAIPVSIVACDVQVTAGRGLFQGLAAPTDEILGAWAASLGVNPTTLRTHTLAMAVSIGHGSAVGLEKSFCADWRRLPISLMLK